jgi:hypothetical protein
MSATYDKQIVRRSKIPKFAVPGKSKFHRKAGQFSTSTVS